MARAVAMLLGLALVASACGDDGGDEEDAEGTPSSGSPIDDVLGAQAVQDFAIHLGMWVLDDSGELVDFYEPLLDEVTASAGEEAGLAGGATFAPVDLLESRIVDASGDELPTLSVDFGLLGATAEATDAIRNELVRALERAEIEDTWLLSALSELDGPARPLLVEIVTADYRSGRTHVTLGDRSEIDITFVDRVAPGDAVAMEYLFGQTLPGDPIAESGLSAQELFRYRWNEGLVRVLGEGGAPVSSIDTSIDVGEGSTILGRRQKAWIAEAVAEESAPSNERLAELVAQAERASDGNGGLISIPGTGAVIEFRPGGEIAVAGGGADPLVLPPSDAGVGNQTVAFARLIDRLRLITIFERCTLVAELLAANNEAGRRPVASTPDPLPSSRFGIPVGPIEADATPSPLDPDPQDIEPLGCTRPDEEAFPLSGGTHGDVRFLTFDGVVYEQQAVGEFLVFENDTTVIQMRAEPAGDSQSVSIATAFAVGTGGESIAMHRGGRTYVDGELRELERGERIRLGGAEVLWGSLDGWTIAWPDGQLVKVFDRGEVNGMTLTVQPAPGAAAAVGQLGDGDGDPENDFRTRGGEQLDPSIIDDLSIVSDRTEFYATYVDTWRITQDESLLHYDEGETAESFLVDGFPSTTVTLDDLGAEARAEAEEVCRAVDARFYDGCVIDVAVTGDPGYAFDAFRVQLVAMPAEESVTEPEAEVDDDPDAPVAGPAEAVLTIGGETLVFGEDPPDQREGGITPSWDCQVQDGNLFADGSIDLADGPRYEISVQYLAAEPRLQVIVRRDTVDPEPSADYAWVLTNAEQFADAVDEVTLDGERLTAAGVLYVNDPPQPGLAPLSQLPAGATLDPFTLDLRCA